MLHTAKQILVSELVLSLEQESRQVESRINAAMLGEKVG